MTRDINEGNILAAIIDLQQYMAEDSDLNASEKVYALLEVAASLVDVSNDIDRLFIVEALNEIVCDKIDAAQYSAT